MFGGGWEEARGGLGLTLRVGGMWWKGGEGLGSLPEMTVHKKRSKGLKGPPTHLVYFKSRKKRTHFVKRIKGSLPVGGTVRETDACNVSPLGLQLVHLGRSTPSLHHTK